MQITIVQAEIEKAIRNHILEQVTVDDDMFIDIDLRATRGPDGYQAIIDIRSKSNPCRNICDDQAEDNQPEMEQPQVTETKETDVEADSSSDIVPARRTRRTKAQMEEARRAELAQTTATDAAEEPSATAEDDQATEQGSDTTDAPSASMAATDAEPPEDPFESEDAEVMTKPEAELTPAPRTSIFGGLNKPSNS